jgi:hypothetical protein
VTIEIIIGVLASETSRGGCPFVDDAEGAGLVGLAGGGAAELAGSGLGDGAGLDQDDRVGGDAVFLGDQAADLPDDVAGVGSGVGNEFLDQDKPVAG